MRLEVGCGASVQFTIQTSFSLYCQDIMGLGFDLLAMRDFWARSTALSARSPMISLAFPAGGGWRRRCSSAHGNHHELTCLTGVFINQSESVLPFHARSGTSRHSRPLFAGGRRGADPGGGGGLSFNHLSTGGRKIIGQSSLFFFV